MRQPIRLPKIERPDGTLNTGAVMEASPVQICLPPSWSAR